MRSRCLVGAAVNVALVLSAPFVGDVTEVHQGSDGETYRFDPLLQLRSSALGRRVSKLSDTHRSSRRAASEVTTLRPM